MDFRIRITYILNWREIFKPKRDARSHIGQIDTSRVDDERFFSSCEKQGRVGRETWPTFIRDQDAEETLQEWQRGIASWRIQRRAEVLSCTSGGFAGRPGLDAVRRQPSKEIKFEIT